MQGRWSITSWSRPSHPVPIQVTIWDQEFSSLPLLPLLYLVLLEHPGLERDALPFLILHRCGMVTIVVYVRAVILLMTVRKNTEIQADFRSVCLSSDFTVE